MRAELTVPDAGCKMGGEAVIQLQQRVAAECDDDGFVGFGQNKRPPFCQPGLHFVNSDPFSSFHDRQEVDAQLTAQHHDRSL